MRSRSLSQDQLKTVPVLGSGRGFIEHPRLVDFYEPVVAAKGVGSGQVFIMLYSNTSYWGLVVNPTTICCVVGQLNLEKFTKLQP